MSSPTLQQRGRSATCLGPRRMATLPSLARTIGISKGPRHAWGTVAPTNGQTDAIADATGRRRGRHAEHESMIDTGVEGGVPSCVIGPQQVLPGVPTGGLFDGLAVLCNGGVRPAEFPTCSCEAPCPGGPGTLCSVQVVLPPDAGFDLPGLLTFPGVCR